jgi:hypothetical protein
MEISETLCYFLLINQLIGIAAVEYSLYLCRPIFKKNPENDAKYPEYKYSGTEKWSRILLYIGTFIKTALFIEILHFYILGSNLILFKVLFALIIISGFGLYL